MKNYTWDFTFLNLFERCLENYRAGNKDYQTWYDESDQAFLQSIGYQALEFFDYVEDCAVHNDPSPTTALLIASVRRDYLDVMQAGKHSEAQVMPADLPAKTADLEGHVWLPRILAKARAKLRGELHPESMFCCGGDRAFLRKHDIAPADFLRVVWATAEDDSKILAYLKSHSST
ncbi:MAG: DUF5069 domain-containing protein [Verrucomicrobiales bacterium]|nr:DUF5069 domain-containing protein [Verrucomicrobiales bacterium]